MRTSWEVNQDSRLFSLGLAIAVDSYSIRSISQNCNEIAERQLGLFGAGAIKEEKYESGANCGEREKEEYKAYGADVKGGSVTAETTSTP